MQRTHAFLDYRFYCSNVGLKPSSGTSTVVRGKLDVIKSQEGLCLSAKLDSYIFGSCLTHSKTEDINSS